MTRAFRRPLPFIQNLMHLSYLQQDCEQPTTIMKPQHEQSDCDLAFFTSGHGMATLSFALGAWGTETNGTAQITPVANEEPPFSFPECHDTSWDDDDDDDSQSCCWPVASSESSVAREEDTEEDEALSAELNACIALNVNEQEEEMNNRPRKVSFRVDCADVRLYEPADHKDYKNLYYTAHELQRMIDEQGGITLLA